LTDPYLLTTDDLNKLDQPIKETLLDHNIKESDGLYISPHELEVLHLTQFLNSSKEPNLDFIIQFRCASSFDGSGKFITNREIKIGEELTIDYGPCAFTDAYDPRTVFSSSLRS
jgi:hypothetical protein